MQAPWCVCLLAAAGLSLAPAQQDVESVPLDWSLELHPDNTSITQDITGILWTHGPSKVAEWESYRPHVEYYGTYKERTELNRHTGSLVVKHVTVDDGGEYSVRVNGRLQSKTYKVEVIKYLPWDAVLELHPDAISVLFSDENITGILWKQGPRKVAEWDDDYGPDVDYYETYKERTQLNKATGTLVIKNMTTEDSGVYAMEVNGRLQSKTYSVEVIKKVPKPVVAIQPLACSPYYSRCTLGCHGDVNDSGLVTYRWTWREDGGNWMVSDSEEQPVHWYIRNNRQGRRVQEYFCEMKNPVSVEWSDPFHNPFVHKGTTAMAVIIVIGRVSLGLAISFLLMGLTGCFVICNHGSRRAHVGAATTEHTA